MTESGWVAQREGRGTESGEVLSVAYGDTSRLIEDSWGSSAGM